MTGEITLRGRVLPVGGIRDKVLAAQRAGIRTVVLPKRNESDLDDVPVPIRRRLRFVLVDHIDEVLRAALDKKSRRKAKKKKAVRKGPIKKAKAKKTVRRKTRSAR